MRKQESIGTGQRLLFFANDDPAEKISKLPEFMNYFFVLITKVGQKRLQTYLHLGTDSVGALFLSLRTRVFFWFPWEAIMAQLETQTTFNLKDFSTRQVLIRVVATIESQVGFALSRPAGLEIYSKQVQIKEVMPHISFENRLWACKSGRTQVYELSLAQQAAC